MLTYNPQMPPKRKDRPWLLLVTAIIWILGTAFFHSPWEPNEPFVMAVVKGILETNSWLVPYVSNVPYLKIQPFYFWIYSIFLKLFNVTNIETIEHSIRIMNTVLIFATVALMGRIGSRLSAFKNGRTVILILISSVGFINNAYQLSPNILVLLGFCLYLYSFQQYKSLPGISGGILFLGLLFISISFTCGFILIALFISFLLPIIDKSFRNRHYLITLIIGMSMFFVIFFLYCYQLYSVEPEFFNMWKNYYGTLFHHDLHINYLSRIWESLILLSWYVVPAWFFVLWSFYKRRMAIFKDTIIKISIILMALLFIFSIFSGITVEGSIFPIILPVVLIASLEIDSVRITLVALLNWFGMFIFGVVGLIIWFVYFCLMLDRPIEIVNPLLDLAQDYVFKFSYINMFFAILITFMWLFMITRKHIKGRELITNWASGTTYVLVLFLALCLPWFDSVLSFKNIVDESLTHLDKKSCVGTNEKYSNQSALWYYYADINLIPGFTNRDYGICNQAVVATDDITQIDLHKWNIVWSDKRPVDKKVFYVVKPVKN